MRAKKFGAMAMAMAMAATMMPMSTFAQEEETYDFGGARFVYLETSGMILTRMQRVTRLSIWMQQHRLRKNTILSLYTQNQMAMMATI